MEPTNTVSPVPLQEVNLVPDYSSTEASNAQEPLSTVSMATSAEEMALQRIQNLKIELANLTAQMAKAIQEGDHERKISIRTALETLQ